jgi:hypothetical protein
VLNTIKPTNKQTMKTTNMRYVFTTIEFIYKAFIFTPIGIKRMKVVGRAISLKGKQTNVDIP